MPRHFLRDDKLAQPGPAGAPTRAGNGRHAPKALLTGWLERAA
jgi:hypothetical protein